MSSMEQPTSPNNVSNPSEAKLIIESSEEKQILKKRPFHEYSNTKETGQQVAGAIQRFLDRNIESIKETVVSVVHTTLGAGVNVLVKPVPWLYMNTVDKAAWFVNDKYEQFRETRTQDASRRRIDRLGYYRELYASLLLEHAQSIQDYRAPEVSNILNKYSADKAKSNVGFFSRIAQMGSALDRHIEKINSPERGIEIAKAEASELQAPEITGVEKSPTNVIEFPTKVSQPETEKYSMDYFKKRLDQVEKFLLESKTSVTITHAEVLRHQAERDALRNQISDLTRLMRELSEKSVSA